MKLELEDKTTKVFVNSTGTADDVAPDVKAFLDYVNELIVKAHETAVIPTMEGRLFFCLEVFCL